MHEAQITCDVQVLNRSRDNMKISAAHLERNEERYFRDQPPLKPLPASCKGLPALIDKLTSVQAQHIEEFLPKFRKQAGPTTMM